MGEFGNKFNKFSMKYKDKKGNYLFCVKVMPCTRLDHICNPAACNFRVIKKLGANKVSPSYKSFFIHLVYICLLDPHKEGHLSPPQESMYLWSAKEINCSTSIKGLKQVCTGSKPSLEIKFFTENLCLNNVYNFQIDSFSLEPT